MIQNFERLDSGRPPETVKTDLDLTPRRGEHEFMCLNNLPLANFFLQFGHRISRTRGIGFSPQNPIMRSNG